MATSIAGASAPSPRARPASNCTWPVSLAALGRQHLVAARHAAAPRPRLSAASVSSEWTKTWMPSLPENAVSPRSETMNHWVAIASYSSAAPPAGSRHHHVDAGAAAPTASLDREGGGDVGVERLLDLHLALPHLRAALLGQPVDVVAVEVALEVAPDHGVDQVAVADAIDLDCDRRGVDADHRNAALAGARQHIGLAGEARDRLAVAHIDVELGGLRQRLLHGRRECRRAA